MIRRGPKAKATAKAGFTLIEALVVIAITSLIAGLLFTIGARGGQTVLRLGNRALDTADSQLARDTFRSVITSLVVPPLVSQVQADGGVDMTGEDDGLTGDAAQLSGHWLGLRATACGRTGDVGRMVLALTSAAGHTVLTCQLEDATPITLLDLGAREVHFQYSEDGVTWTDTWDVEPGEPVENSANPSADLRRVYVKLASADGQGDLLALTATDRTINQAGGGRGG